MPASARLEPDRKPPRTIGPDPAALRSAGRLIRAIAKGRISREDASPRLYLRLREWIELDVARKWSFRDVDSPKDVFYQTLKRVVNNAGRIQEVVEANGSLQAYIWMIATGQANDRWRWEQRTTPQQRLDREFMERAAVELSPEMAYLKTEKLRCMHRAISKLPVDDQDLLSRRYDSEQTAKQIAVDLGRDVADVRKDITRVIRQVRRAVRDWR